MLPSIVLVHVFARSHSISFAFDVLIHFPHRLHITAPSFNFSLTYVSETMEDQCDVTPSMIAAIYCPPHLDCKLRVNVYYSSSLTGGKEVLLAGTTFSKRELLRAADCSCDDATIGDGISANGSSTDNNNASNSKYISGSSNLSSSSGLHSQNRERVLISEMNSEHCASAKVYVEIVKPWPPILRSSKQPFLVTAEPYPVAEQSAADSSSSSSVDAFVSTTLAAAAALRNPLEQHYAFYDEVDNLSPRMEGREVTWEPRFAGLVPALFLENFTAALMRSINAWHVRAEMERKRQGRFRSLEEAFSCGWHSIKIAVLAARIGDSRAQNARVEQQQWRERQAVTNSSGGGGRMASVAFTGGVGSRTVSTTTGSSPHYSTASGAAGGAAGGALYSIAVPMHSEEEAPAPCSSADDPSTGAEGVRSDSRDTHHASTLAATVATTASPTADNTKSDCAPQQFSRRSIARAPDGARRKIDESAPSTFVKVSLEHR